MATLTLEAIPDRAAWEARVEGERVGLVFRERRVYRGIPEGDPKPLASEFQSREAAARALARRAGHDRLDPGVVDVDEGKRRR